MIIKSRQHPVCKLIRSLGQPRERHRRGMFLVPGGNAVTAALAARWPLERLLVTPEDAASGWEEIARVADVPLTLVDEEILQYLSDLPSAPDVLGIAKIPDSPTDSIPGGLTLVLDGIGDPGNIGTLFRSADSAGAGAVVVSENSADPYGAKAVRASAGSLFNLPPLDFEDCSPAALARRFSKENLPVVIAVARDGESCLNFDWPTRCALVLGHETRGVSEELDAAATSRVTIPIFGRAESLNVAAAGAVLLYSWRRQH